jgi:hypothetical protein
MNDFGLWFSTGMEHISDLGAYDHILFVTLLVLAYPIKDWRKLVILITAFTLGHSLSLALSIYTDQTLSSSVIEFLIALSILVTALFQLVNHKKTDFFSRRSIYLMVLLFGFIHGMGFSFLLKAMLGKEVSVFLPLLYFNLGLEFGQLIIVAIVLVFSLFITKLLKWPYKIYILGCLCLITLIALKLSLERVLLLFS